MAFDNVLLVFILLDVIFLVLGALLIALPILAQQSLSGAPNITIVAQTSLLNDCPLKAILANGVLMILAFAISFPAIFLQRNRFLLKFSGWLVYLCAIISLCVGLSIWFVTLRTTTNLAPIFESSSSEIVSMLQNKFQCCGYRDPTRFVMDATCPSAIESAKKGLCAPKFHNFANQFLNEVFTAMFGVCAIDGLLILAVLCVLKDRAEKARYRLIDSKIGIRG